MFVVSMQKYELKCYFFVLTENNCIYMKISGLIDLLILKAIRCGIFL